MSSGPYGPIFLVVLWCQKRNRLSAPGIIYRSMYFITDLGVPPVCGPTVRSNTHYAYHVITPFAICLCDCRLHPLERYIRQCGDHTVRERERERERVGLEILDSKGIGRCC